MGLKIGAIQIAPIFRPILYNVYDI